MTLRRPVFVLLALFLAAAGPTPDAPEAPRDVLKIVIPNGLTLNGQYDSPAGGVAEYIPSTQQLEEATDMLRIIVMPRDAAADIKELMGKIAIDLADSCALRVDVTAPTIRDDAATPFALVSMRCGKSKRFGRAEAVLVKVLQGRTNFFQVQRIWRFAPSQSSIDTVFTRDMIDDGMRTLNQLAICDPTQPTC